MQNHMNKDMDFFLSLFGNAWPLLKSCVPVFLLLKSTLICRVNQTSEM